MKKLHPDDLLTLEAYARARVDFRRKIMEHKKNRVIRLGSDISLHFEDELTMRYQVQEMLRVERIFEPDGILAEVETYNPMIPEGSDWRMTMMIEYSDPEVRKTMLKRLIGIDSQVWVRIGNGGKIYAISDEDPGTGPEERTAAVHFMKFPLRPEDVSAAKGGAPIQVGISHEQYTAEATAPDNVRLSLLNDLD